ncbi:MAG: phasin family protein, partial [Methylocella sp.]
MANEFEDVQNYGKEQFGAAAAAASCFAKTLQTIASETADYSKKALENNSAFMEKLLGAKSYDTAIQIHSDYW